MGSKKVYYPPKVMFVTPQESLATAVDFVQQFRGERGGCRCPCCGHLCVLKRYHISDRIVRTLIRLYRLGLKTKQPVHRSKWCPVSSQGNHGTILSNYRLIKSVVGDSSKPCGRSGYWYVTQLGVDFLLGKAKVPRYVIVYEGERIGRSKQRISIVDALGTPYDPMSAYDVVQTKKGKK